ALAPDVAFYQRLLARDQDEAADIVAARLEESDGEAVADELLVRALVHARRDRDRDEVSDDDERLIVEATREIGEELAERLGVPPRTAPAPARGRVVGCAAHDDFDEAALHLLAALLDPNHWEAVVLPAEVRGSELMAALAKEEPEVICIA